jgi:hypothetical protein
MTETDDLTLERIAHNQSTFRDANERIEAAASSIDPTIDPIPFICECGDRTCVELLTLDGKVYEEVREHARRFFCISGHQRLAVDAGAAVVIAEFPGYVICEKIGRAGQVAEDREDGAHG